jgi:hypothetical protein
VQCSSQTVVRQSSPTLAGTGSEISIYSIRYLR